MCLLSSNMASPLKLLLILCIGQLVRHAVYGDKDPLIQGINVMADTRTAAPRGNTSTLATRTRLTSKDTARPAGVLSRDRGEMSRTLKRHHRARQPYRRVKMACSETPTAILVGRLGPAFNARYMSIDLPHKELSSASASLGDSPAAAGRSRSQPVQPEAAGASPEEHGDFRVDGNFSRIFSAKPTRQTTDEPERDRTKRAHRHRKKRPEREQWECAQKIVWRDLGADFFPRYLRSVVCTQTACWFGAFECRPRAFTVKVRHVVAMCAHQYDIDLVKLRYPGWT